LEVLAASLLVAGLLSLFALALTQFAGNSDLLLAKQRAVMAAEAVLNEIRSGREPTPAEFSARFRKMTLHVERHPCSGRWEGLTLVTVRIRTTARGDTPVVVRLDGCIREAD
jgi:hypothetical protein